VEVRSEELTGVDLLALQKTRPHLPHLAVGAGRDVPDGSAAVSTVYMYELELNSCFESRASSRSASDIFQLLPWSHRVADEDGNRFELSTQFRRSQRQRKDFASYVSL